METLRNAEHLKQVVIEKYGRIAESNAGESCCGSNCGCGDADISMAESYAEIEGYNPEADLNLGCGLPTKYAHINRGDTVLDLGSGAGNDAFVARSITGPEGEVIGVDITDKMIQRARLNAEKLGFTNVKFRLGDIEELPVDDNSVDVVVSNCVLNLVPAKEKAFHETFRVLKPGGHFSISDIVIIGTPPSDLISDLELYVGCVAGAIKKEQYLNVVKEAGFTNITVQNEKRISVPDKLLNRDSSNGDLEKLRSGKTGVYSITLYAEKPAAMKAPDMTEKPAAIRNAVNKR